MIVQRPLCQACVLPESQPDIRLNPQGICNLCVEARKSANAAAPRKPLESDLVRILNQHRGRRQYDCLVMCSGGKDSTSSLYYAKKRYRLNPLAFTFDNGFESEEALENIRRAVEALQVDFLYYRSDFMKALFSRVLHSGSKAVICHLCSIWNIGIAHDVAARYDIPIIIAGWTKGQSSKSNPAFTDDDRGTAEFRQMTQATQEFLRTQLSDLPQYQDFPKSVADVLKRARKRHRAIVLSPHWFLPYGPEVYVDLIKREFNWTPPKLSYPAGSTNCLRNFAAVYNSMKYYGYTHYHVEASKLIREGMLTREEALQQLEWNFGVDLLNSLTQEFNYRFDPQA